MRRLVLGCALGTLSLAACANDFDTSRSPPPRGTLGEELYGVLCDRIGGQALHEDMTGASFHAVCHMAPGGAFADKVDQKLLPAPLDGAVDQSGKPLSLAQQKANRAAAVGRVEAFARRRADFISAMDATFPDIKVAVKDVKNPDGKKSCNAASGSGDARFHDELSDMLGRFQDLYNDGTIPQSTESLARLMQAFKASPEAQQALARFDSRQGYRPVEVALGAARPVIAYPRLRDLSNATLRLLSADSDPYAPDAKHDSQGNRILMPGAANAQFLKMLEVANHELVATKADASLPPLTAPKDTAIGRDVLSRPRDNLEVMQQLFYAQDPAFGGGDPRFIVKRDARGYASVTLANGGVVPAPFVDANHDGLADVDDLGRFVTTTGADAPTPFFTVTSSVLAERDAFGRALFAKGSPTMYENIDTSHTFAASLLNDLKPLVNPDPQKDHETLMSAIAGALVIFGSRDGSDMTAKTYPSGDVVKYNAFHTDNAAMLDLIYAMGQILGDRNTDDVLAYVKQLFVGETPALARLAGNGLAVKAIADKHDEAKIPGQSVFWDEMLDVLTRTAAVPGLLEEILRSFGDDASLPLGGIFSNYMKFKDRVTYDKNSLNGPPLNLDTGAAGLSTMKTLVDRSKPDVGANRSAMQRFTALIHETNGVTACNKDKAVVHAKGVPLVNTIDMPLGGGTYKECEVFKIENLAKFYLQSIIGKANLYFRPSLLRNGVLGIGAAKVDTIEQSSGIGLNANDTMGFWDPPGAQSFHPRPQWLNRLVFFDIDNDTQAPTHDFLRDLQGKSIGTSVCPERVISDPDPTAADASPDGKVHGLRACQDGDWLAQRGAGTLFTWEQFGFYDAIAPLLKAYANHNDPATGKPDPQEDLFLEMMEVLHRHWADDKAAASECNLGNGKSCSKDGVVSYEPLVAEAMATDLFPALHDFVKILDTTTITRCTVIDPQKKTCSPTGLEDVNGVTVIANATRALLDPAYSKSIGLKTRAGKLTGLRNDGTTNPQVTGAYLLTNALSAVDKAFADYASTHPDDQGRLTQWRKARSQLVDQFLAAQGSGKNASFKNAAIPKIMPVLIDVIRAQLYAHCPTSFTPPYDRCAWAKDEMTQKVTDVVKGPTFAGAMDLLDAIRKDDAARTELEALLSYLLDAASDNEARASMLASTADIIQIMRDDTNLVPLYHVLAQAVAPSTKDASGKITQKGLVDAQTALLAKISGRAFDKDKTELCNKELDPNQILTVALSNLVTPMTTPDGKKGQTPLQIVMDIVGDVNRLSPDQTDKLQPADYASITDNVTDFLLNKERGLEQFYEIVRQGTVH